MAALVKEFIDFETGEIKADADPYNWSGAVGASASLVTSPAPPYGTYSLQFNQDKDNSFFRGPLYTYTAGTRCITCAYIRVSSTNFPPTNPVNEFVAMISENDAFYWRINLNVLGQLQLVDSGGTTLSTWTNLLTDTWYRIELVWEPGNSSSAWEWFISNVDADPVRRGGGSGADFDLGTDTDIGFYLRGQGGLTIPNPLLVHHGGAYIMEGVTDIDDRVGGPEGKSGDWRVLGDTDGKLTKNSATPDCDEDGNTGSLDDLDAGDTWDEAGDGNLTTECVYTRAPGAAVKGGGVGTAAPKSTPSDMVYAGKWLWYAKASGINNFKAVYGKHDPVAAIYNVYNTTASTIRSGAYRYWRYVEDPRDPALAAAPDYGDQFVIGMLNHATSGRTNRVTYLAEGWCYSLHAVPVITGKPSIGRFGNMWRGKKGRPL
ncbi:MAG: hypothetical protein ACE5HE_08760 [Phycisphaerae bacterium]